MSNDGALILLVEAKNAGSRSMRVALEKAEFQVIVAHTGKQALHRVQANGPDVIVFDTTVMRSNGARTCRRLRKVVSNTPLIHCRDGGDENPNAEADVYLLHPFTPRKLLNRIVALLPPDLMHEEVVRCGSLIFYRHKRSVEVEGIGGNQLTPKLTDLLDFFLRHPCEVISRKQLMLHVWQTTYVGDTRTLDVHIRWIREYIEKNPAEPEHLVTVRGQGYLFQP